MPGSHEFYDQYSTQGVKRVAVDVASNGDNTLVAAVSGYKIRVLAFFAIMTGTATTIRFESGAGGTALSGQMQPTQGGGFVLPYNPVGWCETASGGLLNLELGAAASVDGILVYALIKA